MRLVDVDNLENNLRLMLNRSFLGEVSPHESVSVGEIATLIKSEPTAYDVDKVEDLLIENSLCAHADDEPFVMLDEAIEIVRSCVVERKQ